MPRVSTNRTSNDFTADAFNAEGSLGYADIFASKPLIAKPLTAIIAPMPTPILSKADKMGGTKPPMGVPVVVGVITKAEKMSGKPTMGDVPVDGVEVEKMTKAEKMGGTKPPMGDVEDVVKSTKADKMGGTKPPMGDDVEVEKMTKAEKMGGGTKSSKSSAEVASSVEAEGMSKKTMIYIVGGGILLVAGTLAFFMLRGNAETT